MRRILIVLILIVFFNHQVALALSVGYQDSSSHFTIAYQTGLQNSIEPIFQVVNNSVDSQISSWQLKLEVRPVEGSQGDLLFHDVSVPPDSLFGQDPRPIVFSEDPSNTVLVFDFTSDPDGELVSSGSARNILKAKLVASANAAGAFQLVMWAFNPEPSEQDNSSSWFPANASDPVAFDNLESEGVVLLGTINVDQGFKLGDYDHDGHVGTLDYIYWRSHFGNVVGPPGEDADGNQNSVVDAADYVVWRAKLLAEELSPSFDGSGRSVPETGTLVLGMLSLFFAFCSGRLITYRRRFPEVTRF